MLFISFGKFLAIIFLNIASLIFIFYPPGISFNLGQIISISLTSYSFSCIFYRLPLYPFFFPRYFLLTYLSFIEVLVSFIIGFSSIFSSFQMILSSTCETPFYSFSFRDILTDFCGHNYSKVKVKLPYSKYSLKNKVLSLIILFQDRKVVSVFLFVIHGGPYSCYYSLFSIWLGLVMC